MNSRELIETIRRCKDGTPQFNALLEECALKIEEFLGGPEETPAPIPAKLYRINPQIGHAKHSVSFYDGEKTHPDGSPFWGIAVYKNKKNLVKFVRGLEAKGYQPE